jgi:hypothetical protein
VRTRLQYCFRAKSVRAMPYRDDAENQLRSIVQNKVAVIVAGTGVSVGASRDPKTGKSHPQASWTGLLKNGLEWLKTHELLPENVVSAHLTLLGQSRQTHNFISAAEDISAAMGGVGSTHFAAWLERTVGAIQAHDRGVVDALQAHREYGNLLATTNYDDVFLKSDLNAVTWKESEEILTAVRHGRNEIIIFLHGYWQKPETIILDWKSYDAIGRDQQYREDFAAFWKTKTWVYVGCGISGLTDPDSGLLLERYGARARMAGHWDYCLVLDDQRREFQAHFDKKQFNICAVSFGDSYEKLPGFLLGLLPARTTADQIIMGAIKRSFDLADLSDEARFRLACVSKLRNFIDLIPTPQQFPSWRRLALLYGKALGLEDSAIAEELDKSTALARFEAGRQTPQQVSPSRSGTWLIGSSAARESAFAVTAWGGSLFGRYFIEALEGRAADELGIVTVRGAFEYVSEQMRRGAEELGMPDQHPILHGESEPPVLTGGQLLLDGSKRRRFSLHADSTMTQAYLLNWVTKKT